MDEALRLSNDGDGLANECGQSPLGKISSRTVPEITLRRGAEYRDMIRQGIGDIAEEIRSLRKLDAVITIGQPILLGSGRVHHFLQAQGIRVGQGDIRDEFVVELSAPTVQADKAHAHSIA